MAFLKQHRKAELQLDGRKLRGKFEGSLTNARDREVIQEFVDEIRKQLKEFSPTRKKAAAAAPKKAKSKARRKK